MKSLGVINLENKLTFNTRCLDTFTSSVVRTHVSTHCSPFDSHVTLQNDDFEDDVQDGTGTDD